MDGGSIPPSSTTSKMPSDLVLCTGSEGVGFPRAVEHRSDQHKCVVRWTGESDVPFPPALAKSQLNDHRTEARAGRGQAEGGPRAADDGPPTTTCLYPPTGNDAGLSSARHHHDKGLRPLRPSQRKRERGPVVTGRHGGAIDRAGTPASHPRRRGPHHGLSTSPRLRAVAGLAVV